MGLQPGPPCSQRMSGDKDGGAPSLLLELLGLLLLLLPLGLLSCCSRECTRL